MAVKTLLVKNNATSDRLKEEFQKEEEILIQLHHPHLVQVI